MTAPYLLLNSIRRQLILKEISCPSLPSGQYQARSNGAWVPVNAAEPRISTGATPLRALHLRADDRDALNLLRLETELRPGRQMLEIKHQNGEITDIAYNALLGALYLHGQFYSGISASEGGEIDYEIPIEGQIISGTAHEVIREGLRTLVVSDLDIARQIVLAETFQREQSLKVYLSRT